MKNMMTDVMIDLSGVCDSHGVIVFCAGDAAHDGALPGTEGQATYAPLNEPAWPPVWYWASHQHLVLTGKPNGPHPSRTAALAEALVFMSAHDNATVLQAAVI